MRLRVAFAVVLVAIGAPAPARGAPILGHSGASLTAAESWAAGEGASPLFRSLAPLYWRLAPLRGVRPDVAYAQAAKETGFGHFRGVLDASFRNPCGLKRHMGGGNLDPSAHKRFPSWRAGVAAHLDHLALYAGARGYPRTRTPDPRHFGFLRGRARTIESLGARWAPDASYGRDLARLVADLDRAGRPRRPPRAAGAPRPAQSPPHRPVSFLCLGKGVVRSIADAVCRLLHRRCRETPQGNGR